MDKSDKFTGLILAGGKSRRFGSEKAAFAINKKPMIAWVYDAMHPLCLDILVSIANTPPSAPIQATIVKDEFLEAGPLAGLHAGLKAAQTTWVIVAPVDMPFVDTALLRNLAKHATTSDAVLVRDKHGVQPLLGCYQTKLVDKLQTTLMQEQYAVMSFIKTLSITYLDMPDVHLLNINKPSDLPT